MGQYDDDEGGFTGWMKDELDRRALKEPWCAYANPLPDDTGQHMVIYAEEGEPGYYETTYTGDYDYCEKVAAAINQARDITPERASSIVLSSIAAQNRSDDE